MRVLRAAHRGNGRRPPEPRRRTGRPSPTDGLTTDRPPATGQESR
ncbi:hypothetical protein KPATCC21470_6315 [Kitasatospora purpeofusca]